MAVWHRYFLKEILTLLTCFLSILFGIHILIDYSTHMHVLFKSQGVEVDHSILYYAYQFLKHFDFLLPAAFFLSIIAVVTRLNRTNEWLVLQIAGISSRQLLKPLFQVALICSFCMLFNYEFLTSYFFNKMISLHGGVRFKNQTETGLYRIEMENGDKLLYCTTDRDRLRDVVWIRGSDDFWKIKYLWIKEGSLPLARWVDHFHRNGFGEIEKIDSYHTKDMEEFKELSLVKGIPVRCIPSFHRKSIKELFLQLAGKLAGREGEWIGAETARIITALMTKTIKLFIPFLLVIASVPFCVPYQRRRVPIIWTYTIGLFSIFALYALLDSLMMLSDHSVLSPAMVLLVPFTLILSIFGWRFYAGVLSK